MSPTQKLYIPIRSRVEKNIITRVYRKLGENQGFKLALGQEVLPSDSLGRHKVKSGFKTINLAQKLRVDPQDGLDYLKTKIGQNIYQGEEIADSVISPVDGVIDFYNIKNGELRIKVFLEEEELTCGVFGVIDEIDERFGLVGIRTLATLIHGVLGSGPTRDGRLEILNPGKSLSEKDHQKIVVVEKTLDEEMVRHAYSQGVAGLVCAGVTSNSSWQDAGFGVLIIEGIGDAVIGEDILNTLKECQGRFGILDGGKYQLILPSEDQNSMMYIRKTSLPKVVQDDRLKKRKVELKVGLPVRVISSNLGQIGVIVQIDRSETILQDGGRTVMVTIESKFKKMRLPFKDIEAIY